MIKEADFLYSPSGPITACRERKEPTEGLWFSGGSPIAPLQLTQRQQRCLRLTVGTRLFESPSPNTHYWFSRDMEWWFSAAKQVLDDIHGLLLRQNDADKSFILWTSLRGPWRCGTWKSEVTWLSRFIYRYYKHEGRILHPFRNTVDKHLKDHPDTLRFDIFLLQCWSEMRSKMILSFEQQRTFEMILRINDEGPEVGMRAIESRMDILAPAQEHGDQPQGSGASPSPWIPRPSQDPDLWARLQPELAREFRVMFMDYTRHLRRECELALEEYSLHNRGSLQTEDRRGDLLAFCLRFMSTRILSYIDCVITLAQRELGMVRSTRSSSSGSGSGSGSSSTWTVAWLRRERSEAFQRARHWRRLRARMRTGHGPVM